MLIERGVREHMVANFSRHVFGASLNGAHLWYVSLHAAPQHVALQMHGEGRCAPLTN